MERDFAVRFSDDKYASIDEVKKALAISSIDSIWTRIQNYRSFYRKTLELFSIENKAFSIVLTTPIQQRIVTIEKKLAKDMVYLARLDNSSNQNFIMKALLTLARSYAVENSLTVTDDYILELINKDNIDTPQAFLSLKNYINTIKFYLNRSSNNFDLKILTSFYGKILNKEIDPDDFESYGRLIDHNNPADHYVFGRHYNAAPLDKIEPLLKDIVTFNNTKTFTLIKAIITYFYLIYIKPFDYFNEECSLLTLKYILAHDDLDSVPFLLNLEKSLLNPNDERFNERFILSELSLDLTYFVDYVLEIIEKSIDDFDELISLHDINQIKQEFSSRESNSEEEIVKINERGFESNKHFSLPVTFEQKVSMPTLPVGLDEKDVDLIAENLLELYPSLKRMQARFYASHCTIGKYYSIAQYKKETGVAYETARTSMDNLVNLGFYKKEQIKNKFVYTPVVR